MGLGFGDAAPWFIGETRGNPRYHFSSVAGRYVLLGFPPRTPGAPQQAEAPFTARRSLFDDLRLTCFIVVGEPDAIAQARDQLPGLRWFLDPHRAIPALYDEEDA